MVAQFEGVTKQSAAYDPLKGTFHSINYLERCMSGIPDLLVEFEKG